jgi:hypothetical protein
MSLVEDKFTHKYYLDRMNEKELLIMAAFLLSEKQRHQDDIRDINEILHWILKKVE